MGLGDRITIARTLSGGEQQRGALAVALANEPPLLLADEPTGELDSMTAGEVLRLLRTLNAELGLTTVIVTHDPMVAEAMDRSVAIRDGRTSTEVLHAEAAEETVIIDGVGRLQIPRRAARSDHLRRTRARSSGGRSSGAVAGWATRAEWTHAAATVSAGAATSLGISTCSSRPILV